MVKGRSKWKHKLGTITYNSWRAMRNRCLFDNANAKNYKHKGITICEAWVDDFDQFVEDMGERPSDTTLDRIDSDKGYFPENCRWATHREQQNNKDSLISIEYEGVTHTIGEWAYILDLTDTELSKAYKRHANYGATSFEELFYAGSLYTKRVDERANLCKICGSEKSCKWRKYGELCNTCYARASRWSARECTDIELFHEWADITWKQQPSWLSV